LTNQPQQKIYINLILSDNGCFIVILGNQCLVIYNF